MAAHAANADVIWNRACYGGGENPREGDAALAALLRFHGAAMNGGVFHGVEFLNSAQFRAAQAGYRYFGLAEIAALMTEARDLIDSGEDIGEFERSFGQRYAAALPNDSALVKRFEDRYADDPHDFDPVQ
jgi:hypothetical protein